MKTAFTPLKTLLQVLSTDLHRLLLTGFPHKSTPGPSTRRTVYEIFKQPNIKLNPELYLIA